MQIGSRLRQAALATVAVAATLTGSAGMANAAAEPVPAPATAPRVALDTSGLALTPVGTGELRGTVTPRILARPGADPERVAAAVAAAATCTLHGGGAPPYVVEPGVVYYSPGLTCVGVSGRMHLGGRIFQIDVTGLAHTRAVDDRSGTSPGSLIYGLRTPRMNCIDIGGGGQWRAAVHPRLVTSSVTYDWGWWATRTASLSCVN